MMLSLKKWNDLLSNQKKNITFVPDLEGLRMVYC